MPCKSARCALPMWERVTSLEFPSSSSATGECHQRRLPLSSLGTTEVMPPFVCSTVCSSVSRFLGSPTPHLFFSAFMLTFASPSQLHPVPPTLRHPLSSFSSKVSKPPRVRRVTAYFLQPLCSPLSPPPSATQRHRQRATLCRAPLSSLTFQGSSGHRLFISAFVLTSVSPSQRHSAPPMPRHPLPRSSIFSNVSIVVLRRSEAQV